MSGEERLARVEAALDAARGELERASEALDGLESELENADDARGEGEAEANRLALALVRDVERGIRTLPEIAQILEGE